MAEKPKKILILKTGALGDCILAFPFVKACQKKFGADLVLFAAPEGIRPVARLCGINKFTDVDTVGIHQFFAETFDPRETTVFWAGISMILNLLTGEDHEVHRNMSALRSSVYSLAPPDDSIKQHACEYIASIIDGISIEPASIDESAFRDIHPGIKEICGSDKPIMTVHPGTGSLKKFIGTGPFEDMITRLAQQYLPIILTGPADGDLIPFCKHMAREFDGYHFNSIPLEQIAYIIQKSALYCGLDSGVSHLAALTGTQCRVVFTVTDPDVWRPYGGNVEVITPEEL